VIDKEIKTKLRYSCRTGKLTWSNFKRTASHSGKEAGCITKNGYRQIRLCKKSLYSHRVAWFLFYGEWPKGQIDHINHDKTDNRIENLRVCTAKENSRNRTHWKSTTPSIGVNWNKSRGLWQVRIAQKYKGLFWCLDTAILVRKKNQELAGYHENHGAVM